MLLSDLDMKDLEDITDLITAEEAPSLFTDTEQCDLVETAMQLMDDYITENPSDILEPDFHDVMMESVTELFTPLLVPDFFANVVNAADIRDDIDELLESAADLFYATLMPPRSFSDTFVRSVPSPSRVCELQLQLTELAARPQPQQRTEAWYLFRHNLITASNAYKVFENQTTQNQLIYEKCQPMGSADTDKFSSVNVESTFHWGQKYEPVSVMYYESKYDTRVGDFGCIQHPVYSFLGASPDGINNDPLKPRRFGRMLEIKNIVNRDIDGIPKKEYWVQMQLQMEVCNLDECDFLETRFTEYATEDEFLADGDFNVTLNGDMKGIMLYFSSPSGKPKYVYKPLKMNAAEYEVWYASVVDTEEAAGYCWIKTIFWKLEEVSCVLVLRNKRWFNDHVAQIQRVWGIIETERQTGCFDHRAPNRRAKKAALPETGFGCCLLNLKSKDDDKTQEDESSSSSSSVTRVRTESIDETRKATSSSYSFFFANKNKTDC